MKDFMNNTKNALRIRGWVIIMLVCSLTYGFVYVAIQQYIRLSASDAQSEIVEEILPLLVSGNIPRFSVPVDMATSLKTFVIIYDESGCSSLNDVQNQGGDYVSTCNANGYRSSFIPLWSDQC